MTTQSIDQLREERDKVRRSLSKFRASKFTEKYGAEQEYTAQGMRAVIQSMLVDITAITKAHAIFVQKSTLKERNHIVAWLENMSDYIESEDLEAVAKAIDEIKPTLRNLGVRYSDERMKAFDEFVNNLQRDASEVSQSITDIGEIKSEAHDLLKATEVEVSELNEKIESLHKDQAIKLDTLITQKSNLMEAIQSTEKKRADLANLLAEDEARSQQIGELLTKARSHEDLINNFSKNVEKRQSELDRQATDTEQYQKDLKEFRVDYGGKLKEVNKLIESAKAALRYKTAEGLSAAFTEQYDKADDIIQKLAWLIGAGLFTLGAVAIGVWLALGGSPGLGLIIARISLLPILIAGAWFCTGQYVKQRNIAEDYAYKAVLAKSIMGFSEELSTEGSKGEDHSIFMKLTLSEMLKNPLRKHSRETSAISETLNKITDLFKIKGPE